jgi:carbon storage regulator
VLVFTRRRNESIMVADGIEIRVLRVNNDAVRLGVTAPSDIPVHRKEVYDQIRDENRRAAQPRLPVAALLSRVKGSRSPD